MEAQTAQRTRDEQTQVRLSKLGDDLRVAEDTAAQWERDYKDSEQAKDHAEANLRIQIDNNSRQAETIATKNRELRGSKDEAEKLSTDLEASRGETTGAREQLKCLGGPPTRIHERLERNWKILRKIFKPPNKQHKKVKKNSAKVPLRRKTLSGRLKGLSHPV